jgi:hypothetical protein
MPWPSKSEIPATANAKSTDIQVSGFFIKSAEKFGGLVFLLYLCNRKREQLKTTIS